MKTMILAAAMAAMTLGGAHAQMAHGGHGGHAAQAPYAAEWMAGMARMHADMGVALTGDADVDFVRGMIPHHQGAIDMARVVLEHGDDADVRKLAEAVIEAQEAEIAWMRRWLADNGH